jgi:hypothetical protein
MASRALSLFTALAGAAVLLTGLTAPVSAQPPTAGSTHTFRDPVFGGTVFCDTFEQVRDIAVSEVPNAIYALYRSTPNKVREPICMAIVPTAIVEEVIPIGIMKHGKDHYRAWAIKALVGPYTAFGLYLEELEYIGI